VLLVEEDEKLGIHARPGSSAKASTSLMPLFFFFFFYVVLSVYYSEKRAEWHEANGRKRAREKWELRETDRQAHVSKCLIKQSELAPGAYRKTDRHGRVDE
jgi:hypothetical protein